MSQREEIRDADLLAAHLRDHSKAQAESAFRDLFLALDDLSRVGLHYTIERLSEAPVQASVLPGHGRDHSAWEAGMASMFEQAGAPGGHHGMVAPEHHSPFKARPSVPLAMASPPDPSPLESPVGDGQQAVTEEHYSDEGK